MTHSPYSWSRASMASVRVLWQTVQVKVRTPFSVQVASFVTTPSFQVCWPVAGRVWRNVMPQWSTMQVY